jgi:hypothetical protein
MPDAESTEVLENCIRSRDCQGLVRLFFVGNPPGLRSGFYREDAYWDFKAGCPSLRDENELAWASFPESFPPGLLKTFPPPWSAGGCCFLYGIVHPISKSFSPGGRVWRAKPGAARAVEARSATFSA